MTNLIIFINDFPYNYGEPFFEKELPFLESKFDRIVIFSVVGKKTEKPIRYVSDKIEVVPLGINHNRIKYLLLGFFSSNKFFDSKTISGKKVLSALYFKGRNYCIFRKAAKYLKKKIDIKDTFYIYSYWLTLGIASILIKGFLLNFGVKKVSCFSRCHRYDIYNELHPFGYIPFQNEIIKQMDSVYPCSEHGKNYLIKNYPEFASKIKVARLFSEDHGVSTFSFEDKKILLTISGFRKVKRLDLFAKAFALVAKCRNDVMWYAIGDGDQFENVKKLVSGEKNEERVVFLGSIPNQEVYEFYKNHNVYFFCNVSYSEGIPVSIMEATSFGTPILATDVGGNSEIVNNENGFIIDANINEEQLAKYLLDCLSLDGKSYFHLRKESRKIWEEKYNLRNNLELWYDEIMKN